MEDDSEREDVTGTGVCLDGVSWFYFQDLRGHIAWSAAPCVEIFGGACVLGQPQVNQDWNDSATLELISFDHDVLKFEVSVHNASVMKIANSLKEINHDTFGLFYAGESTLL